MTTRPCICEDEPECDGYLVPTVVDFDMCGCSVFNCTCPVITRETCFNDHGALDLSLVGAVPVNSSYPVFAGDAWSCPAGQSFFEVYYDDLCCSLGICVEECPDCEEPFVTCNELYSTVTEIAAVDGECCPTYDCECRIDINLSCPFNEPNVTCDETETKFFIGMDPLTDNCCPVYGCECAFCEFNNTIYSPGDTIDDDCQVLTCVENDDECFEFEVTDTTSCPLPEPCENSTYINVDIGVTDDGCCPLFECQCLYYDFNGTLLEPGATFQNPNDSCTTYMVIGTDLCPDIIPLPIPCTPVECGPCEIRVQTNNTDPCCGPEFICQTVCDDPPECPDTQHLIRTDFYLCSECCPEYECVDNCDVVECNAPGPIPAEYRGIYPVEYLVTERDECNCSSYNGTLVCLTGACINPFTHETMDFGEEYIRPDLPCMSIICVDSNPIDIDGCGEIEYAVGQCDDVYAQSCPYGYAKSIVHNETECCPEIECVCSMCRVNDTYLEVSDSNVELPDCKIGTIRNSSSSLAPSILASNFMSN